MVAEDRAQVLLLGGLAIAIVFLAAIPLSNSLVVTESASASETVGDIDRAEQRERSIERGVRTVLTKVNTSNTTAVNESLRAFSEHYTNVSGQQNGLYVNASLNVSESRGGVVNSSGSVSNFKSKSNKFDTGGSNDNTWNLTRNAVKISDFSVVIDSYPSSGSNDFRINVSNSTDQYWVLRVDRPNNPGPDDPGPLVVERRGSNTGSWQVACYGDTSVELDLQTGSCETRTGSGSINTSEFKTYSETIEGPYTVTFEQGQKVNGGSYRLAGAGDFPNGNGNQTVIPAVNLRLIGPSYERTILVNETS